MSAKLFYIKERSNPLLGKSYYTALGQRTKKDIKKMENPIYGSNFITSYKTKEEYDIALDKIKSDGYTVYE